MASPTSTRNLTLAVLGLMVAAGVFAGLLRMNAQLPQGPVDVIWDKEPCAECKMHVGEPRFAAQLQTTDGDVLNFDDPGCLFDYAAKHKPAVHAIYFHDSERDAWIGQADVRFVAATNTPMGYGLAAVANTPGREGLLTYDEAAKRMRERPNGGTPP